MTYPLATGAALIALLAALAASLGIGATPIPPLTVLGALTAFDPDSLDHFVVLTQRLPRALIAVYAGAVLASGGAAMQAITGNPLASPSTLGVSAGAMLGMLLSVFLFDASLPVQGLAALGGGFCGFVMTLTVARLTGLGPDPRGLPLILSGALTAMLLAGLSAALLLTDPARRTEYLSWLAGNINHFYADRLALFWPMGIAAMLMLLALARPLTLIGLGREQAAAMGVPVAPVTRAALFAVVLGASSATAICGPIGFVGLVVPHLVRPFCGGRLARILPVAALTGAALCLLSDVLARRAFAPFTLHTGVLLELVGGLCFGILVYRLYLSPGVTR